MTTRAACLSVLVLLYGAPGCNPPRDRFLPVPIRLSPLSDKKTILSAFGKATPAPDSGCDTSALQATRVLPMIFDTATPISAFRGTDPMTRRYSHGQLVLQGYVAAGQPSAAQLLLCDVSLLQVTVNEPEWRVGWNGSATDPLGLVIGGDLLQRFSLILSFGMDPADPLCQPPCLHLSHSSIATSCRQADKGEAVLPFSPAGGALTVQAGDDVFTYPATRITLPACLEPLADPLPALPCLSSGVGCSAADKKLAQMSPDLVHCTAENETCKGGFCPAYDPTRLTGRNIRLMLSTALPGLLLSRTAFAGLRGEDAAKKLFQQPAVDVRFPGLRSSTSFGDLRSAEPAYRTTFGSQETAALVLVSAERHLAPCAELARNRRQRYARLFGTTDACDSGCDTAPGCLPYSAAPRTTDPDTLRAASCLVDAGNNAMMRQQRCAYSGDTNLACNDSNAPMAAVVELGGPPRHGMAADQPDQIEALVVADTAEILQAANADLQSNTPQIDGILGVSVLSRLQVEIDYPGQRVIAHCRPDAPAGQACRTSPRLTYQTSDGCADRENSPLACLGMYR